MCVTRQSPFELLCSTVILTCLFNNDLTIIFFIYDKLLSKIVLNENAIFQRFPQQTIRIEFFTAFSSLSSNEIQKYYKFIHSGKNEQTICANFGSGARQTLSNVKVLFQRACSDQFRLSTGTHIFYMILFIV